MIGVISGSLPVGWGDPVRSFVAETPYGAASDALFEYAVDGKRFVTLARHGTPRQYAPHEINYLANVRALKDAGVDEIVALFTVGGIDPTLDTGGVVVPGQLIDYTWGRPQTYGGASFDAPVMHVVFDDPFDAGLQGRLVEAARASGHPAVAGGVYGCTQGPRLETAAEISAMAQAGCTVVGMTAMPEAALARELHLPYAAVCLVVNPAAGVGAIEHDEIMAAAASGAVVLSELVVRFLDGG